jgi:hypothetical protein
LPRLLAILVLAPLAFAASASAEQPVENQNDSGPGSLRNALATAAPGETIEIPAGTYRLTSGQLVAEDDGITLLGLAGAASTRIEAGGDFRLLCVTGGNEVTLDRLTIHGGRAAAGGSECTDAQGGGVHSESASTLRVLRSVVQDNTASPVQGGGGGIYAAGDLIVEDSIVRDNRTTAGLVMGADNGGGGIRADGALQIVDSTVSGNTATVGGGGSGGGGVYGTGPPDLTNVTLSGNRHFAAATAPPGGGGGILVKAAGGSIEHATFFGNHSDHAGGAIGAAAGATTTLANSLFHANTAQTNPNCADDAADSAQGNLESATVPTCDSGAGDIAGVDPKLGPLAVNGSDNGTLTHELLARDSPAVEFGKNCVPGQTDQRGVARFVICDSGAYEFDGRANAFAPDCSPTGVIPVELDAPPGHRVVGLSYRLGSSPTVLGTDAPDSGAPLTPTSVTLDEGRTSLEYWGRWEGNAGGSFPEEAGHAQQDVLVDKTRPAVEVANASGQSIFVITRRARVNVAAADQLSGLVQDPSATGVLISTGARGPATFSSTAADLCQNQATDAFDYRVLAPGLGIRTVLERVRGTVRVRRPAGGGARASQNRRPFSALTQPRELPVGSFIDSRGGTARLTSARTRREDQIQDGLFSAGVFQVLQSRRVRSRGLTEVRLKGGNFGRCRRARRAGADAAQVSRRVIRRVRGNTRGRFSTRGRHSAATARGTVWQVIDRCDGTLTKVRRGRVAVRDFRRKRTVIVRAGRSYLARAPR